MFSYVFFFSLLFWRNLCSEQTTNASNCETFWNCVDNKTTLLICTHARACVCVLVCLCVSATIEWNIWREQENTTRLDNIAPSGATITSLFSATNTNTVLNTLLSLLPPTCHHFEHQQTWWHEKSFVRYHLRFFCHLFGPRVFKCSFSHSYWIGSKNPTPTNCPTALYK